MLCIATSFNSYLYKFVCIFYIHHPISEKVEEKRAIKKHDTGWHFIYSLCEMCSCQSCRVTNECAVYAKDGAIVAPVAEEMEERK